MGIQLLCCSRRRNRLFPLADFFLRAMEIGTAIGKCENNLFKVIVVLSFFAGPCGFAEDEKFRELEKRALQGEITACDSLFERASRRGGENDFEFQLKWILRFAASETRARQEGKAYSKSFRKRAYNYGIYSLPHSSGEQSKIHIDLSRKLGAQTLTYLVWLQEQGQLERFLESVGATEIYFGVPRNLLAPERGFVANHEVLLTTTSSEKARWQVTFQPENEELVTWTYMENDDFHNFFTNVALTLTFNDEQMQDESSIVRPWLVRSSVEFFIAHASLDPQLRGPFVAIPELQSTRTTLAHLRNHLNAEAFDLPKTLVALYLRFDTWMSAQSRASLISLFKTAWESQPQQPAPWEDIEPFINGELEDE